MSLLLSRGKLRVLFIVRFLYGDEGISVGLIRLAKGLIKYGCEVALASATDEANPIICGAQGFESYGIKHFFVPFPKFKISSKNSIQTFQALLKLNTVVSKFKPDVINVHSLSMCPYAQFIRLWYKIPFVSTPRIEPLIGSRVVSTGAFINKYFSSFLGDRLIAISSEVKNVYQQRMNIPQEKIRLVCHGVDNEYFRPPSLEERIEARKAFNLDPKSKVVCLIGRLDPIKGHEVLFKAISLLKSKGVNVIAICAGTGGKWKDSIQKSVADFNISESVNFPGFVDPRKVLWASDVLTLPSKREGFGWVIPEAMLCGVVPVRTPSAGAIDQIEDSINGFIVPFDDPDTLALRLQMLLENNELKMQMSAAALKSAQLKFTADRMTKDTIALYEEVINETVKLQ